MEAIELAKDRGENYIKFQNLYSGGSSQYLSILSMYYMAYELELRRHNIMVKTHNTNFLYTRADVQFILGFWRFDFEDL